MRKTNAKATLEAVIITALLTIPTMVLSQPLIFTADTGNNRIQVFDLSGTFITQWGKYGKADGEMSSPAGVAAGGFVYAADTGNNRIQKFKFDGTWVSTWGGTASGQANGMFSSPNSLAVNIESCSEYVYVADTGNNRVQKFTADGVCAASWTGAVRFNNPQGITADPSGRYIYVADTGNNKIQKLDTQGNTILSFGGYGTTDGKFKYPRDVAVDSLGRVYVADNQNYRIQRFSSSGVFETKWGTKGEGDGQFWDHYGVSVDGQDNIYAADAGNNRVQVFTSDGVWLKTIGSLAQGIDAAQFYYPMGVDVYFDKPMNPECMPTMTFTGTFTETPVDTATHTFTETFTSTLTDTATHTFTETFTQTPVDTATNSFTETFTETPTDTATHTFTETFTKTPTDTATHTFTETFTKTPTDTATNTFTETFTETPVDTATAEAINTAPTVPDKTSTAGTIKDPKPSATPAYTAESTLVPTEVPTAVPTLVPTEVPTAVPTLVPTEVPTLVPTKAVVCSLCYSVELRGKVKKTCDMPAVKEDDRNGRKENCENRERIDVDEAIGGGYVYTFRAGSMRISVFDAQGCFADNILEMHKEIHGKRTHDFTGWYVKNLLKKEVHPLIPAEYYIALLFPSQSFAKLEVSKGPHEMEEMSGTNTYNYPNPSSGRTAIRFALPGSRAVDIVISDVTGRIMWQKHLQAVETVPGANYLVWEGADDRGVQLANGTYILRVMSGGITVVKKIAIVR